MLLPALAQQTSVAKPPVFRGPIRLPSSFETPAGRLEKGAYVMEVTRANGSYVLSFFQGDSKKLALIGHVRGPQDAAPNARIPIVGAHFLRFSEDPLPTGQERQFSKTGAAQYEEEKRDWKGVMRLYRSPEGRDAWFVFQERGQRSSWTTVDFKVALTED
jgi:hypothetical protein